jgi:hypothetical protein
VTYRDNEQEPAQSRSDDAKKQKQDQILAACRSLTAQGFNKDQIAQQLSAKYAMTTTEVNAILDQDQPKEKDDA